ncbi:parkin coregulated gene protein-like [Parasteatoda tepidariorum]|uniref:parkin coregulated gene protein-like n=1 Tax=Parasteatoda tepidariorum TaxID=114398 RepID=UPI0039BD32CB
MNPLNSQFRCLYKNGMLPLVLDYRKKAQPHDICWMVDRQQLDAEHYLPIFCDALNDPHYPFDILARDGTIELLEVAGERVLTVLPDIVLAIKKALNTEHPQIMMNACAVIQRLTTLSPLVSLALIRHYRVLLVPFFCKYKTKEIPYRRGEIHYGQRRRHLADVINQTLDLLDRTGGPDAYAEIKYAVPTYQSAYHNS